MTELQEIKEEIARQGIRLDNVEGYFANFDTTLTNHMTDYAEKQKAMGETVRSINLKFNLTLVAVGILITSFLGLAAAVIAKLLVGGV